MLTNKIVGCLQIQLRVNCLHKKILGYLQSSYGSKRFVSRDSLQLSIALADMKVCETNIYKQFRPSGLKTQRVDCQERIPSMYFEIPLMEIFHGPG